MEFSIDSKPSINAVNARFAARQSPEFTLVIPCYNEEKGLPETAKRLILGSFPFSIWALWTKLFTVDAIPGWASTLVSMYFLGGIQLLSVAVVGEYISKIYIETKARPMFLLRETSGMPSFGH